MFIAPVEPGLIDKYKNKFIEGILEALDASVKIASEHSEMRNDDGTVTLLLKACLMGGSRLTFFHL